MATLIGSAGDDTLIGTTAEDSIIGAEGNDLLIAEGSFDTLIGGPGADTLDASSGTTYWATGDYSQSPDGVFINMSDTLPETGGDAEGDVLRKVQIIIGSAFDDSIVGISGGIFSGANNSLYGGDGNDTLIGGIGSGQFSGTDTFEGGAGQT